MSDQVRNTADLERALRLLAEKDCAFQAPPRVEAAVMQTWDAGLPFTAPRHRRHSLAPLVALAAMAAAVVVTVIYRTSSEPRRPESVVSVAPEQEQPPVVTSVPLALDDTSARTARPQPRKPRRHAKRAAAPHEQGLMLAADPVVDPGTANIVRVRMPRSALVPLGILLVEPDQSGSVDVELVVDDDGVARTIRRAVPVTVGEE
jgi:hypothetical protein